jgi:hypothetical protein
MSFDDVLQSTGRRDDDFCTRAEVELLLLDGTLLKAVLTLVPSLSLSTFRLTPPTIETQVNPSGPANFLVSDSIC